MFVFKILFYIILKKGSQTHYKNHMFHGCLFGKGPFHSRVESGAKYIKKTPQKDPQNTLKSLKKKNALF